MHRATLDVLGTTGVEVRHDRALGLLAAAGARVEGTRVRIPAALIEEALATAPRCVTVATRGGGEPLRLETGATYYGTGSDCIFVLGPGARDRRPATLADVEAMAALQEKLPDIDFVMSMAHPHELAAGLAPVAQFAAMLRGTSKPLLMVPEDATHLERFTEMAA
ncbi:MAG TPA: trimethylamine methyltransferase family protein, partial [Thermoleophilia bacterium]|nr:trimethylamine methyltransferase family protein [Thermoleophilia bacterium]